MTIQEFFTQNTDAAVAFSGGVDSAWLLHEAMRYARRTAAYFVRTPFQPDFELEDAQDTARRLGAPLKVIPFDILAVPAAAANQPDRCYHCKRALFSDDAGDRPGMRALRELGVRSPLRECGIAKAEIRTLARAAGLPVWDKPSYACLATRIPTGTAITAGDLARVARGEAALLAMGFSDLRLRLREDGALLQVRPEQMAMAGHLLPQVQALLAEDFAFVRLDSEARQSRET